MKTLDITLVDNLDGRPVGILDSDLSKLLGLKTKHLNRHAKRNLLDDYDTDFRFRMTMKEFKTYKTSRKQKKTWGGRRYLPYVYTFKGVCLLVSRLRLDLMNNVKSYLLMLFNQPEMLVFDFGVNRPEERVVKKLLKILDGIVAIQRHYHVVLPNHTYFIDIYLPDYKIAIEVDEEHHKYSQSDDTIRQQRIRQQLQCVFVRVHLDDDFDGKVNEILKLMKNQMTSRGNN